MAAQIQEEKSNELKQYFQPIIYVFDAASSVFRSGARVLGFGREEYMHPARGHLPQSSWMPTFSPVESRSRRVSDPYPVSLRRQNEHRDLAAQAHDVEIQLRGLRKLCEKGSAEHMSAVNERKNFRESMAGFETMLSEFARQLNLMDALHGEQMFSSDDGTLQKVEELLECCNALGDRAKRLQDRDTTLMDLHGDMGDKAQALSEAVHELTSSAGLPISIVQREDFGSELSQKSSIDAPSLITQYMDKRGDLLLLQEMLHDLDAEHADYLQQRELHADRNDDIDMPNAAFEDHYQSERERILHELEQAEAELMELGTLCAENGQAISGAAGEQPLRTGYVFVNRWRHNLPSPDLERAELNVGHPLPEPLVSPDTMLSPQTFASSTSPTSIADLSRTETASTEHKTLSYSSQDESKSEAVSDEAVMEDD